MTSNVRQLPDRRSRRKVVPNPDHPYARRLLDDVRSERQADYAELRETEMRRIARECERERGGNSLHLGSADWSPAFSGIGRIAFGPWTLSLAAVVAIALYVVI